MKIGQFGSAEKYKMLGYLTEHIELLDKNKKEYLSKFITEFNTCIKKFDNIIDIKFKNYLLDLTLKSYFNSIDKLRKQKNISVNSEDCKCCYDKKLLSYLENYVKARINNAREVKYINFEGHTYMISDEKIRKNDLYIYHYSGNNGYFINTANNFQAGTNDEVFIKPAMVNIAKCKKLVYIK